MSTKALMDVDGYLRTSVDGVVVERNRGELPRSDVQGNPWRLRSQLGIRVEVFSPEDRITRTRENPGGGVCGMLRTGNPRIEIPLADAFDLDA